MDDASHWPVADPKMITSHLSGPFTEGDTTVDVQIHRLKDTLGTFEVIGVDDRTFLPVKLRMREDVRTDSIYVFPYVLNLRHMSGNAGKLILKI